jgi:hypothetical protein
VLRHEELRFGAIMRPKSVSEMTPGLWRPGERGGLRLEDRLNHSPVADFQRMSQKTMLDATRTRQFGVEL